MHTYVSLCQTIACCFSFDLHVRASEKNKKASKSAHTKNELSGPWAKQIELALAGWLAGFWQAGSALADWPRPGWLAPPKLAGPALAGLAPPWLAWLAWPRPGWLGPALTEFCSFRTWARF